MIIDDYNNFPAPLKIRLMHATGVCQMARKSEHVASCVIDDVVKNLFLKKIDDLAFFRWETAGIIGQELIGAMTAEMAGTRPGLQCIFHKSASKTHDKAQHLLGDFFSGLDRHYSGQPVVADTIHLLRERYDPLSLAARGKEYAGFVSCLEIPQNPLFTKAAPARSLR